MKVQGDPPSEFEVTPLILATIQGKQNIVELLVENKANVNYASEVSLLYAELKQK